MATLQRGKKYLAEAPEISEVRALSRAELSILAQPRPVNSLQTLRDTHHRIARAIASGMSNDEVSFTCGISYSRVSVFRNDPAFKELIAHYRSIITSEWAQQDTVIEYMKGNALKAARMMSDKLEDAEEKGEFLPTRDLVAIQEFGFDRTGYGKVHKNLNVNVDFAANLEAMRKRASEVESKRAPRTIEASVSQSVQEDTLPSAPRDLPALPSFRRF